MLQSEKQSLFEKFHPVIAKVIMKLKVKYVEYGDSWIEFNYQGMTWRLELKEKKS